MSRRWMASRPCAEPDVHAAPRHLHVDGVVLILRALAPVLVENRDTPRRLRGKRLTFRRSPMTCTPAPATHSRDPGGQLQRCPRTCWSRLAAATAPGWRSLGLGDAPALVAASGRSGPRSRSRAGEMPEGGREPNGVKDRLALRDRPASPVRIEAVAIPRAGELPEPHEVDDRARGHLALLAPSQDVVFRPEEKNRRSGEADVAPPVTG